MRRLAAICLVLLLIPVSLAQAAKSAPTPTPPPLEISQEVLQPPAQVQQMLDIAHDEWVAAKDKTFKRVNKYTEWRGKGVGFGWCGGFITWCMMEAGIPMAEIEEIEEGPVSGVVHVKEAAVSKLLQGYQRMYRSTLVPQKGFLVVYGAQSYNRTNHIGLVVDVQPLGDGKYRLTTLEGNMGSTVKMFVHDYDMLAEETQNLTEVPAEERVEKESKNFSYEVKYLWNAQKTKKYFFWINCFLMPWLPGEHLAPATPSPSPTPLSGVTPPPDSY